MRFTKKLLATALAFMMVFALLPAAVLANDTITVTIDGQQVQFEDQGPVMVGNRVMVPVRGVFEALGFDDVDWNRETRTATLTRSSDTVIITIGSDTFTTNGVTHALDVPAQLIGGRTLLPLAAVLESLGYTSTWDAGIRIVIIITEQPTEPEPPEEPPEEPEPTPQPTIEPIYVSERALSIYSVAELLDYVSAEERLEDIRALAEAGDALGQLLLGMMYHTGSFGISEDPYRAITMYRLSADQGLARGIAQLAVSYAAGIGVESNREQSVYYARIAAEMGNALGLNQLAFAYASGQGVPVYDHERAVYYWHLSVAQGSIDGKGNLAVMYYHGMGVDQCYYEAARLWRYTAEAGHSGRQFALGAMYRDGRGVEQCYETALYWFDRAAEQGNEDAQEQLNYIRYGIAPPTAIGRHLGVDYTILPEVFSDGSGDYVTTWQFIELHGEIDLDDFPAFAPSPEEILPYYFFGSERGDVILAHWWNGTVFLFIDLGDGQFHRQWISN